MSEELAHIGVTKIAPLNSPPKTICLHLGDHDPKKSFYEQDISFIEFKYKDEKLVISSHDFFYMMQKLFYVFNKGTLDR